MPRPGVTAAATTAVLATGDGPRRDGFGDHGGLGDRVADHSDSSHSCWLAAACQAPSVSSSVVGFDGGDDGLDRDASVGDELATGAACGRRERRRPDVLVDEHAGHTAGLHRRREVLDVLLGEQLGQLGLELRADRVPRRPTSSMASTVPSSSLMRIRTSMTRMVPASTSLRSSSAISPVKCWLPRRGTRRSRSRRARARRAGCRSWAASVRLLG